ncbi:MAG: hypothetical protein KGL39_38880 [Patescibacteria group bacterium]|nr:hypothetical protein [Patescibacteria group bacterium]
MTPRKENWLIGISIFLTLFAAAMISIPFAIGLITWMLILYHHGKRKHK